MLLCSPHLITNNKQYAFMLSRIQFSKIWDQMDPHFFCIFFLLSLLLKRNLSKDLMASRQIQLYIYIIVKLYINLSWQFSLCTVDITVFPLKSKGIPKRPGLLSKSFQNSSFLMPLCAKCTSFFLSCNTVLYLLYFYYSYM